MKSRALYLVFFLSFNLYSCNNRQYTLSNLPEEQLIFGDGGGFTGAVTEYRLLKNGQLFRSNSSEGDTIEVGQLDQKQAKQLLQEAEAMHLEKMNIQEPGNMYYFIGLQNDRQLHKVIWGDPQYQVDARISSFYKKLMQAVKQAKAPLK